MPSFGFIPYMVSEKKIFNHFYENRPFLPPQQPIKFTDLDKSHMKRRGLLNKHFCNALVICNHAPHPLGIAGTLTFVLQIPAKSPALRGHPVGKTTALFPPQSVMCSLHCHVCLYKTNPWHLPRTAGTIKK